MSASQQGSDSPRFVETNGSGGTAQVDVVPTRSTGVEFSPSSAALHAATYTTQVHAAFMLGWSIAELRGRIQVTLLDPTLTAIDPPRQTATTEDATSQALGSGLGTAQTTLDNVFWQASCWRICFSRISLLHQQLLPDSTTASTRFDPGLKSPEYLFPDPPGDYADVGVGACDADSKPVLASFALCEATRRAINCLVLLYLKPELSLLPDVLLEQKAALVQAVLGATPNPDTPKAPGPAEIQAAIGVVSQQTLLFLAAWDVFLRESFLTAGLSSLDEAKLIAYQAGTSMAGLSWSVSANALPIELDIPPKENAPTSPSVTAVATPVDSSSAWTASQVSELARPSSTSASQLLRSVWQQAFEDQNISRLQHQILVLGKGLDDDYAARSGQDLPAAEPSISLDPSLPSRSLQTVTHCLDYWQRAVQWLNDPARSSAVVTIPQLRQLRLALIEQANVWQALVLGQEDLRSYRGGNVIQQILQEVMSSFEEIAAQQGIVDAAADVGRELSLAVEEATVPIKKAIGQIEQVARNEVLSTFLGVWPLLLILVAVGVLGIGAIVLTVAQHPTASLDVANLPTVLATIFGGFGLWHVQRQRNASTTMLDSNSNAVQSQVDDALSTLKSKTSDAASTNGATSRQPQSLADRMGRVFGTETATVLKAFEDGYKQIQTDLADLGYAVSVAYPLVEYFVINPAFRTVRADYDFVIQILWDQTDRKAEVMRVAYAAFGPIGLFALAKIGQSGTANQVSAASSSNISVG
ncbi:MAG TPA: hypothetical protein VMW65_06635 [Chloroflexota bacterium]|nr:hypothetical protein [Chloroflexota bacterium]